MEEIATSIREDMKKITKRKDKQWPLCSNTRLINLQLVKTEGEEGFGAQLQKNQKKKKHTPISCADIFTSEEGTQVNRVIVEGNAGLGKTTFSTILNRGWAEFKMLDNFECTFLLPLRNKKVYSAKNLKELMKLFHISDDVCTAAVREMKKTQGKKVLFIADGWDELDVQNRSEESFLYDLLINETILPFASVLITSRPSASSSFHYSPFRFIEILGFDQANIEQYIESEFEKDPEKAEALIKQISGNSLLQSICSIPLNCALICHVGHNLEQTLPNSITKLYSLLVLYFVLRNFKKTLSSAYSKVTTLKNFDDIIGNDFKCKFWHICKFAYECLLADTIMFSKEEIKKNFPEVLIENSNNEILCFGLLQSAESPLVNSEELHFHFAHLTIQEFLAALHVATQTTTSKIKINSYSAKEERFEMMWKFVFGLCNRKEIYSENIEFVDENFLNQFLLFKSENKLLLCHCAAEIDDSTFSAKVASKLNGDLSVGDDLLDCNAVFHILRHSSPCSHVKLDLSGCGLRDGHLKDLSNILSKCRLYAKS